MSVNNTKRILKQWGRWAGGGGPVGFPMMSTFMRWRSGDRQTIDHADPEVLACDAVVRKAESEVRRILVRHYCGNGTGREKAARSGLSKSQYYSRLSDAEWYVHTTLETVEVEYVYSFARIA